jgi:hypothetical protein
VPNSGLTTVDVTAQIKTEIDDEMCGYYNQRNLYCTYTLQASLIPRRRSRRGATRRIRTATSSRSVPNTQR